MKKENPNILNFEYRKQIIETIEQSQENIARKRSAKRTFDIIHDKQARYIVEALNKEFSAKTVAQMRKVTHINLAKRIVDEKSSIYDKSPRRVYVNATDKQKEQLDNLYNEAKANVKLRRANFCYNGTRQGWLYAYPSEGKINLKLCWPHQLDVIPDINNPEKPFAYVLSVYDYEMEQNHEATIYNVNDGMNTPIGDKQDYKSQVYKYIVWTKDVHYSMAKDGSFILEPQPNPIGMLPFIEFSIEKDSNFFVDVNNVLADFAIDQGLDFSDLSNQTRLQGFAQAVVYAEKPPENLIIGPNHVIFLKLDPLKPEIQPKFEFVSPSPEIAQTLDLTVKKLELFMIGEGVDPTILNKDGSQKSFNSALERMIAMIQKFEASRSDFDLFACVERELFKVLVAWSNALQGVVGDLELQDNLKIASIPDSVELMVNYAVPEDIQTIADLEASVEKRMGLGLMSKKKAIMELDGVDEETAIKTLDEIKQDEQLEVVSIVNNRQEEFSRTDDQP